MNPLLALSIVAALPANPLATPPLVANPLGPHVDLFSPVDLAAELARLRRPVGRLSSRKRRPRHV